MKSVPFLRDIDDEALYARQLETAWVLMGEHLAEILARFPIVAPSDPRDRELHDYNDMLSIMADRYADLATMRHTLSLVSRDIADRRRRLADVAVGLTDRVLDKQSTQAELGAGAD